MSANKPRTKKEKQLADTRQHAELNVLGKVAPQESELEAVVLGTMMLDRVGLGIGLSLLQPDHFYKPDHRDIMRAITDLAQEGGKVDIMTVCAWLKKDGTLMACGGPASIAELTGRVASSANLEQHCLLMLQSWMKREAIRVGMEAVSKGYDDTEDALDLISDIQSQLLSVSGVLNIRHAKSSSDGMEDYMKQILTPRENNLSGVDTGYSHFNKFTGGWQRSDVYVIAARPGVGKTAFGLNFAWRCAAIGNAKALFCSLEMPDYQIKTRLLSMVSTCTYQNIQNQYYTAWEKEQIQNHGYRAFPKDLWLDDTPALTPSQLRSKIIHMRSKVGCDIVFVDYLQLMTDGKKQGPFTNREQEVSSISRQLKAIAMEFNIPIVAMAQLNRESTKRAGGKPLLSDLRESGSIEQDASTVMFPWNPHENKVDKENGEPYDPNTVFMLVQKHRNGALDDVPFYVVKRTSRVLMPGEDSKNIFHVNHEENDNRDEGF